MKKIFSLTLALLLLFCITSPVYAVVDRSDSFYVADYSNVLSNDVEQMIIDYNGALEAQCGGAQIVVVTVDYLDGMYSDEYAYQLFNAWGVGSSEYNNGMLLLLAIEENKAWLAYGLGLNSVLSSSEVDGMLDRYFWDDFDAGDYNSAVSTLFRQLLNWYDSHYSSAVANSADYGSGNAQSVPYQSGGHVQNGSDDFGFFRVILFLLILYMIFGRNSGTTRSRGGSWLPWFLFFNSASRNYRSSQRYYSSNNWRGPRGGGFGGGGFSGGGFGGGSGHGGGGFSGGGGGRR